MFTILAPVLKMPLQAIRPAQPEDYTTIAAIYNEAIAKGGITMDGQPYSPSDIQTIVEKMSDRETLLVAETPQKIVGWGIIKRYSDRLGYQVCCETSIYLTCAETGKGYGTVLQKRLMQMVAEYGYHHIVAKILATNRGSVQFHQRFGFEVVGVQKEIGYVNGTWHDVVIMQCLVPNFASVNSTTLGCNG